MTRRLGLAQLILILACVLLPVSALNAEEPALKGRLVSPSGVPIRDFPITVTGDKGRKVVSTTDEFGNFSVRQLSPGIYKVAPANEPDRATTVEIKEIRPEWYQFWKDPGVKNVDIGDIQVETGKKY